MSIIYNELQEMDNKLDMFSRSETLRTDVQIYCSTARKEVLKAIKALNDQIIADHKAKYNIESISKTCHWIKF